MVFEAFGGNTMDVAASEAEFVQECNVFCISSMECKATQELPVCSGHVMYVAEWMS